MSDTNDIMQVGGQGDTPPSSSPAPSDGVQSSLTSDLPGAVAASTPAPQPAPQPQAAPAPAQPFWKTLLIGAMRGIAGADGAKTFGGGVSGGANGEIAGEERDFKNKITSAQSAAGIRFQDMESAKAAADINRTGLQIAGMKEDQRQAKEKFGMDQVDFNQRNFGTAYKSVPFTQDNARLYLQQASNGTAGAHVPDGIVVTPSTLYIPVSDSENTVAADYTKYKAQGDALGLNPISRAQYMAMNPTQRRAAAQIGNEIFSGNATPQQVNSRINLLQSSIAGYANKPNADPGMLQHMKDVLAQYQHLYDMNQADKDKDNARKIQAGVATASARNNTRMMPYIDGSGLIQLDTAQNIHNGGFTPLTGQSMRAASNTGQINDIGKGIDALEKTLNSVGEVDPVTAGVVTKALQATNGVVNAGVQTEVKKQLSPDQQQLAANLLSMHERVMAIRGLLSVGAGSDAQRAAIQATVPDVTDPLPMRTQKLAALRQIMSTTQAATPRVAGLNGEPVARHGAKPAPQAQPQHTPGAKAALPEGQTGTGSDGKKYIVKGGVWVPQ